MGHGGRDIYDDGYHGSLILGGVNSYTRILDRGVHGNRESATYLPVFFGLSAAVQAGGVGRAFRAG